jgi:hypothetical protein
VIEVAFGILIAYVVYRLLSGVAAIAGIIMLQKVNDWFDKKNKELAAEIASPAPKQSSRKYIPARYLPRPPQSTVYAENWRWTEKDRK